MLTARPRLLAIVALISSMSVSACRDNDAVRDDGLTESTSEFLPVDYELTSDLYKKWLVAQENLNREAGDADLGLPADRVSAIAPTPGSIDTITAALERNERTKNAIESAGLSVRDYVLTTLALYQTMQAPGTRVAALRPATVQLVSANRDEISRARESSRVRFVSDRDSDSDRRPGKGRGRGKGKKRGRGHN